MGTGERVEQMALNRERRRPANSCVAGSLLFNRTGTEREERITRGEERKKSETVFVCVLPEEPEVIAKCTHNLD